MTLRILTILLYITLILLLLLVSLLRFSLGLTELFIITVAAMLVLLISRWGARK